MGRLQALLASNKDQQNGKEKKVYVIDKVRKCYKNFLLRHRNKCTRVFVPGNFSGYIYCL